RAAPDLLGLPVGEEQPSVRGFTDDDASGHPIQHRLEPATLGLGLSLAKLRRRAPCLGFRLLRLDGRLPIAVDRHLVDYCVAEHEIELAQAGGGVDLKGANDRAMDDDERKQE